MTEVFVETCFVNLKVLSFSLNIRYMYQVIYLFKHFRTLAGWDEGVMKVSIVNKRHKYGLKNVAKLICKLTIHMHVRVVLNERH